MFDTTLFGVFEDRGSKEKDKKIISKLSNATKKTPSKGKTNTLKDKMELIRYEVNKHLSFLFDKTESCREEDRLRRFVDNFIKQEKGAIDTETLGLDYFNDKIFGWSAWAEGDKSIYVPMEHYGYVTGDKLQNQLSLEFVSEQFKRISESNTKLVFHNAKFDIHMIYHNYGVKLPIWWDTMIASRLLHSSEKDHSLKYQYNVKVKQSEGKPYDFKNLFDGVKPETVPIDIMTPYAAGDTFETLELQRYQEEEFKKYPGIYNVFMNIEMPLLPVVFEMEETGVAVDREILSEMDKKYTEKLKNAMEACYDELDKYSEKIAYYNMRNPGQLSSPINLSSSKQMSIVFYDILGLQELNKFGRSTGKEVLNHYKEKNEFVKKLSEVRDAEKLVNAFIKSIPEYIREDGRIHADFVQIKGTGNTNNEDEDNGADTGRFACIADGQLVITKDGEKPIESVEIGDVVQCYDRMHIVYSNVIAKYNNGMQHCFKYKLEFQNGEERHIECTEDHKVLHIQNYSLIWRQIGELIGQYIAVEIDGVSSWAKIISCEDLGEKHVWDLEVENQHNFYVNKILVHNCKDPNLQQIPARGEKTEIRKIFKATDGYMMMSADYSQQEPRLLAHCSNDKEMQDAYKSGKDLYALMASKIYNRSYEECKEFYPDGTVNKEGKARRSATKAVLLGLMYGRGQASIAEQTGSTLEEAKNLIDTFYSEFPNVRKWMNKVELGAEKNGYVETLCGRRRELPDALLDDYEFKNIGGKPKDFNPLDFSSESELNYDVDEETKKYYINKLNSSCGWKIKNEVIQQARADGIEIKDNSQYKARAKRQSVNTIIQGTAADMSKLAMIKCAQNEELRRLGYRLLFPVHDEIIAEAPIENAKRCGELMSQMMIEAANEICPSVPFKCDTEYMKNWSGDSWDCDEDGKWYIKDKH